MNYENEITVEVDTTLENLISILENRGFKLKEAYDLNDIYLINKLDKKEWEIESQGAKKWRYWKKEL